MPVAAADLVIGARASDPTAFHRPQPPLGLLCVAAGLERRDSQVAHTDSVWAAEHHMRRAGRIFRALTGHEQRAAATTVLDLADHDQPTQDALRQALDELRDPDVAHVVIDELLATGRAPLFSGALLDAAETARHIGAARFVAALIAEQSGEVHVADAQLHLALEADPYSAPTVERCAWYASDRGNAAEAVRLWHQLGGEHGDDLNTVEPFTRRLGPKLGRNEPCWCGSGRKYKMCHPGQHAPAPLPERIGWLCRKAIAYLEHSPDAQPLVMTLAQLRAATAEQDGLLDAAADPIVLDTALTDGGWFARFVDDRGPLLPDDEALLAATGPSCPAPSTRSSMSTPAPPYGYAIGEHADDGGDGNSHAPDARHACHLFGVDGDALKGHRRLPPGESVTAISSAVSWPQLASGPTAHAGCGTASRSRSRQACQSTQSRGLPRNVPTDSRCLPQSLS
jgi:hypothetical protein